jgi:rhodanese-related sulfurtransferase
MQQGFMIGKYNRYINVVKDAMQHRRGQMSQVCAVAFSVWLCAAVLIINGCHSGPTHKWDNVKKNIRKKFPTVKHISTGELHEWLNNQESFKLLILDRREPEEYAVSHLPGAVLVANEEEAFEIIANERKERSIVIYCSVGYRSSELAEKLQEKGFTEVYNLEGSMFKWANEGRELYRGDQLVNTVHPFNSKWKQLLDERFWYDP